MYIMMVSSECAPVAKVGGLGDVVFGLSRELEIRGNAVEIILPKYDCMRYDHIWGLQITMQDLWVPFLGTEIHCSVYFGFVHGRKCYFIDPHSSHNFFNRGIYYGHADDPLRFAFFSKAALEFMLKSGKHPDVIHCHDWQTGLLPVLLFDKYRHFGMTHSRVCYTLHNVKHQGVTGAQVLHAVGLHDMDYYFHKDRLGDDHNSHAINLMKAGIVYSNFVTTVSPRYAWEISHTDQGFGLGHVLWRHGGKFGGVLNGVDYGIWNPEVDAYLPKQYSVDTLDGKYENKRALRERFLLRDDYQPIVAYVGRLDHQKGMNLVEHALYYCLANGAQFVLLGSSPEPWLNNHFRSIKHRLNDNPNCHLEIGYDEELSHLIYAGADMFIVPSLFEPCGLTQLIALKYGTVPVVRDVGGLSDTVFDADHAHRPYHERNGYVFKDFNNEGLESALRRAIGMWYSYPQHFRELISNGMRYDYSWSQPGMHYMRIYEYIKE